MHNFKNFKRLTKTIGHDYYRHPLHHKWKFGCIVRYNCLREKGKFFIINGEQQRTNSVQIRKANSSVEENRSLNRVGLLVNILLLLLLMMWMWNFWMPFVFQVCIKLSPTLLACSLIRDNRQLVKAWGWWLAHSKTGCCCLKKSQNTQHGAHFQVKRSWMRKKYL